MDISGGEVTGWTCPTELSSGYMISAQSDFSIPSSMGQRMAFFTEEEKAKRWKIMGKSIWHGYGEQTTYLQEVIFKDGSKKFRTIRYTARI